jgi:hypothetical protein
MAILLSQYAMSNLERTRVLVFVERRRESMSWDKVASMSPARPRAAQL